jgi:alpha-1,6-mannosyltransferase
VRLLPFGVERSLFAPGARDPRVRQALLGTAREGSALLVGVGRFAIEKEWDVVLDAFFEVRRRRSAVLVLFGDGPERSALEKKARGSDVRFLGFERDRQKLAASLASADVLVHGCSHESFGFAVAEAMSAGLPVVVPDKGGASELADGESCERYRAGDPRSAADAVLRMLDRIEADPDGVRARLLVAAQSLPTVREQFEGTYAAYSELLRGRAM